MSNNIVLKNSLKSAGSQETGTNNLFPVFLKLEQLKVVIVGGGYVGNEKLQAIINNSPLTKVKIVATNISEEIRSLAKQYNNISFVEKAYEAVDIKDADIVFAALNDSAVSKQVSHDAKQLGKLVNAADKPRLCDFYLSSVVQKGSLKLAISTNGKSPTVAKRIKELLTEAFPDEIDELLNHMVQIRKKLSGDFSDKVKQLNEITKELVKEE